MATSSSTNFTLNRDELIRSSFEDVGVAVSGEPLATGDINKANVALNMMLKAFQQYGLHLWKRKTVSITFVASQASYTLGQKAAGTATTDTAGSLVDAGAKFSSDARVVVGDTVKNLTDGTSGTVSSVTNDTTLVLSSDIFPDGDETYEITSANVSTPRPLRILEANRVDSSSNTTTMNPISKEEYFSLPNRSQTGTPIQYYYEPTLNNGTLYVWLVPDATAVSDFTMEVVTSATIEDMDSATDDFDCPSEWLEAIAFGLAYRLSFKYPLEKLGEQDRLKALADDALELAIGFGMEDASVYFSPETERA